MAGGFSDADANRALKRVAMEAIELEPRHLTVAVQRLVLGANAPHRDVKLVVLDSIQGGGATAGTDAAACRAAVDAARSLQVAGIATILVGHVTKQNLARGPRTLEHAVDVVVHLDRRGGRRTLTVPKNRFGPAVLRRVPLTIDPVTTRLHRARHAATQIVSVNAWLPGHGIVQVQAAATLSSRPSDSPAAEVGRVNVCRGIARDEVRHAARCLATALEWDDVLRDLDLSVLCRPTVMHAGSTTMGSDLLHLPLALAIAGACLCRELPTDLIVVGELDLAGQLMPLPTAFCSAANAAMRANELRGRRMVLPAGDARFLPWNCGCDLYGVSALRAAVGRAWPDLDVDRLSIAS
jgi:DNA repair protein RadA/Sms